MNAITTAIKFYQAQKLARRERGRGGPLSSDAVEKAPYEALFMRHEGYLGALGTLLTDSD